MNEPQWHRIPCFEGWWWDGDNGGWVEMSSSDMSTAIVDMGMEGLWYGPIIIPEKPDQLSHQPPPAAS